MCTLIAAERPIAGEALKRYERDFLLMVEGKPPESVTLAAPIEATPPQAAHTFRAQTQQPEIDTYSTDKLSTYEPIVILDRKPPLSMLMLGLLIAGGAVFLPFVFFLGVVEVEYLVEDSLCCFFCNGIAFGLGIIGVYSIQYGIWEQTNDKTVSATFSYIIGGITVLIGLISIWIYFTEMI